jgi:hypothetical protein
MRQRHNIISQKGRQKINDQIMLLKRILPECRDVECNKASILNCAVRTLEKFNLYQAQVMQANVLLERENRKLLKIIEKLEAELNQCRVLHSKSHSAKLLPMIDNTLFSNLSLEPPQKKPRLDHVTLIPCDGALSNSDSSYIKLEISTDLPQVINLGLANNTTMANNHNTVITPLQPCSPSPTVPPLSTTSSANNNIIATTSTSNSNINADPPPPPPGIMYDSLYSPDGMVFKTTVDVPFSNNPNWPLGISPSVTTAMTTTATTNAFLLDPMTAMNIPLT